MKLFDSNLIIYSVSDKYKQLRAMLISPDVLVSVITKVETLGYHKLPVDDRVYFETLFASISLILLGNAIVNKAIELRQQRKMSLGDCLIAATALLNGLELYTNNMKDFINVPGLSVINPLNEE